MILIRTRSFESCDQKVHGREGCSEVKDKEFCTENERRLESQVREVFWNIRCMYRSTCTYISRHRRYHYAISIETTILSVRCDDSDSPKSNVIDSLHSTNQRYIDSALRTARCQTPIDSSQLHQSDALQMLDPSSHS